MYIIRACLSDNRELFVYPVLISEIMPFRQSASIFRKVHCMRKKPHRYEI